MFKNAMIYRIVNRVDVYPNVIEDALQATAFTPCGLTQQQSVGWTPPRSIENGPLLEFISGQWMMRLTVESKKVPAQVLKDNVDKACADIEHMTGHKPGKRERKELAEDVLLALLPHAFPARYSVNVWMDRENGILVLDCAGQSKADMVTSQLIKAFDGLTLQLVNTSTSPAGAMARWLTEKEPPTGFTIDRECELKAGDESKAVVKYGRHALDIEEVAQHIAHGKMPTKLAMTWDDRVSFVLTEGMQIKKIAFLDVVMESNQDANDDKGDAFDADVAILTGEFAKLIPDLIEALGGEVLVTEAAKSETEVAESETKPHIGDGPDPLYDKAVEIVRTNNKASISLVQRHLKIGYNRAARLVEDMEKAGIVSGMTSSGTREILVAGAEG